MPFELPASLTRPNLKKGKKAEDLLWPFCVKIASSKKEANELFYLLEPYTFNYMRVQTSMQAAWDKFGKDETSPMWLAGVTAPRDASIERIIARIAQIAGCDKYLARAIWLNKFPQKLDYKVCEKLEHDTSAIEWFITNNDDLEADIRATASSLAEDREKRNADECSMPLTAEDIEIIKNPYFGIIFKTTAFCNAKKIVANATTNEDGDMDESVYHLFTTPRGISTETWLRLLYSQLVKLGMVNYDIKNLPTNAAGEVLPVYIP